MSRKKGPPQRPRPSSESELGTLVAQPEPVLVGDQVADAQSQSSEASNSETSELRHSETSEVQNSESAELPKSESQQASDSGSVDLPHSASAELQHSESAELQHSESAELQHSESAELQHSETSELRHSETSEVQNSESAELPKFAQLERKDVRLRPDQVEELRRLAKRVSQQRTTKTERITENTLLRVAVDMVLARGDALRGNTEEELRQSGTAGVRKSRRS